MGINEEDEPKEDLEENLVKEPVEDDDEPVDDDDEPLKEEPLEEPEEEKPEEEQEQEEPEEEKEPEEERDREPEEKDKDKLNFTINPDLLDKELEEELSKSFKDIDVPEKITKMGINLEKYMREVTKSNGSTYLQIDSELFFDKKTEFS